MSSQAQVRKDKIIADLLDTRRKILDAAAALPPTKRDEVFLGIWSVKDLLAHLAGWDVTNRQAAAELLAGQVPGFYAHYDHDWQTYNASLVAEYGRDDFAELLSLVEDTHRKLVAFLETVPAEEFDRDHGVRFRRYKVTLADLLQVEADDEKVHLAQIEEFRQGLRELNSIRRQTEGLLYDRNHAAALAGMGPPDPVHQPDRPDLQRQRV